MARFSAICSGLKEYMRAGGLTQRCKYVLGKRKVMSSIPSTKQTSIYDSFQSMFFNVFALSFSQNLWPSGTLKKL